MTAFDFGEQCWFLTGPTAGGKTAVALELAKLLPAEILSLDSMAVYRGMDIGTAKPTHAERSQTPHHLVDLAEPNEEYSVAQYLADAEEAAQQTLARGRQALFVGGTPLYLKALLRGIFEGPPADWTLRAELQLLAEQAGPQTLHDRLRAVDAVAAERLHPNDTRRVIRALEVHQATSQPISDWQQQFERSRPAEECRVFVLDWPRDDLYRRINRRVDAMFAAGLVEEVASLLRTTPVLSRTAGQAVGYREVIEHLQGQHTREETIDLVKTHTRQFAKRQMTWFRSLSECRWISVTETLEPAAVAKRIWELGRDANARRLD